jgi:1-phosphofructokinase family hexose kinase
MIICLGTTPALQKTLVFARFSLDAVNRAMEVRESASGKSLNVVRTLHTWKQPALAGGFVGGHSGQLIRADLDRASIAHDLIEVRPTTRTCVTVLDRSTGKATELVEEPAAVEPQAYEQLLQWLESKLPTATMLILSGSLPPQAPQDFYARCTEMACRRNLQVILDARGSPLQHALAFQPTFIKPNRLELQENTPFAIEDDASLRRAIEHLLSQGPQCAIITDGARPILVSDGKQFWQITPPPITPINPIGSGDAFAAGLAMGLLQGQDIPQACQLGAACGAANALSSPPGHGRPKDVRRLLPLVKWQLW